MVLTTLCASGCTAVQPECPREWFEPGLGVYGHEQGQILPVDDASGFSLNGGYDFNADPVVASLEFGLGRSENNVVGDPVHHDFLRWTSGLRLTTRMDEVPLGFYARGGWFWRDESAHGSTVPVDDFWGMYAGAGMEWWYMRSATLGPFFMVLRGADGDFQETFVGFAARFYIDDYYEGYP